MDQVTIVCEKCAEIFEDELSATEYEVIDGKVCEFCGKVIK